MLNKVLDIVLPISALQLREYLPHRYPMALLDRVTALDVWTTEDNEPVVGQSISGFKNVSVNEEFLQGHFVETPIMPGVLIIEAMAQLSGILGFIAIDKRPCDGEMFLLASTDKAKFKKQVIPGDRLDLHAAVISRKRHFYQFSCTATVDGGVVATADVMLVRQSISTI